MAHNLLNGSYLCIKRRVEKSILRMPDSLNILLAPLDWGLGHATRCIPLIRYLLEKNCRVTLAAHGSVALLLKSNFPQLRILPIEGYNIRYSATGNILPLKILMQVPEILRAIKAERQWLRDVQDKNKFDLIISDNRYGLKIKNVPSVILTHQLTIKTGAGPVADSILRRLHYNILEKFDACWIVDALQHKSIGGELSHPSTIPSNARYIGILSQLELPASGQRLNPGEILVLLSGPEPQRTQLENIILNQIPPSQAYRYVVVGGRPEGPIPVNLPSDTIYYTHRNASELANLMGSAEIVICRSGYSTLMDLAFMGKKALLIPTPGQSEQLYLASYLKEQGLFSNCKQSSLNLENDIKKALTYPGFQTDNSLFSMDIMKAAVDDLITGLAANSYNAVIK
ncbi:glycosyl transferase [Dyadobacter sp. CY345]|uniref:glycosyltransferase n=1 Tax=Dyadobacter sp. CY345 TaxID=2909335 RepID=UPI001F30D13A|nr:glycosyltransferase [Dyadobacter sp. CY345]MCF2447111.1 glycosyl transferase [Dyadobacter sp. CY345]